MCLSDNIYFKKKDTKKYQQKTSAWLRALYYDLWSRTNLTGGLVMENDVSALQWFYPDLG